MKKFFAYDLPWLYEEEAFRLICEARLISHREDIILLRNRSIHLKNWACSRLYMSCKWSCYLGESWAGKGIDSLVNTVQGPVFNDAEVNPAANLTYSENRLADIHGNTREPFESSIFCPGDWELNSWYNFLCEDMIC